MTKRNKTALLAAVCVLLTAPALAQPSPMPGEGVVAPKTQGVAPAAPAGPAAPAEPVSPAKPETLGAAPAAPAAKAEVSTRDFVTKAAMAGMFEVQAAKLAERKDRKRSDQTFAKQMIKDHGKANDQLRAMVKSGKVKAQFPAALDSEHQQKLDELKKLSGKEFDKAYDDANKMGHEDAVAMFESYSKNGDNPQLKQWAAKTLPTLKKHLSMAKKLQ